MKKFLFIVPQSPERIINPFRRSLIDTSLQSLRDQRSDNWEALMLGEEDRTDGNFHFIRTPVETKEEKLHFAVDLLLSQKELPEYIIRFDDDDVINTNTLFELEDAQFDCYADEWHFFYDAASGSVSMQKRAWLPNTVIHKTEHALAQFGEYHYVVKSDKRRPHLLQNDHSKWWHQYYRGKKVMYAGRQSPLYMRVLSPSSFTASSDFANPERIAYSEYLSRFGDWKATVPSVFVPYVEQLKAIWQKENGPLLKIDIRRKQNIFGRLFNRIK